VKHVLVAGGLPKIYILCTFDPTKGVFSILHSCRKY